MKCGLTRWLRLKLCCKNLNLNLLYIALFSRFSRTSCRLSGQLTGSTRQYHGYESPPPRCVRGLSGLHLKKSRIRILGESQGGLIQRVVRSHTERYSTKYTDFKASVWVLYGVVSHLNSFIIRYFIYYLFNEWVLKKLRTALTTIFGKQRIQYITLHTLF